MLSKSSPPRRDILFLDIDGVLCVGHHRRRNKRAFRDFDERCVRNLKYLLDKVPSLEVVFTSTWRSDPYKLGATWERAKLDEFRILSHTPFHPHRIRGLEIKQWIAMGQYPFKKYAVLDDETCDIKGHIHGSKIFKVTFKYGLTMAVAKALVKHFLKKQPKCKKIPT